MNGFKDAFISYGRKDSKAFVTHLHQRLVAEGLSIWFDFDDIPLGVDFQNQIDDGIETSHNFLFVIAPHSVNSPYCLKEIELALRHHKRIIPLLHVEEIDYDTWRDRNPSASDDEWETYRAQGLHTSFINMHPEIAKINWVYFREGVDDFEAGFAGLLETMGRQQDYVHQHTHLLQDALSWERQQRQMSALLSQAEARQAYSWLTTTFAGEQPPCAPTTLQGEFITESLKQASGGMTQVFLSYSEENRPQREEIHRLLQRQGFTVWVNTTDIQTGSDFEQAIRDGVEKADSVVYLLSPSSLTSRYCQQELEFAQSYNKRIIPLLIHDIDEVAVPEFLRVLQFIDFRPDGVLSREQGLERLLQVLQEDADYYDCHKRLLVKALIWERHRRRKRYLLRGNAFVEAETWLTASRHQTAMPPTRLHEVFIEASQDINRYFDAFISYGRADSLQFAVWVQDQLSQQGLSVWLDKNDIPVGVDFQTQIDDGISKAHNVIFIISPHSANSPYCLKELELALRYNKRIIPVMQMERIGYDTWRQRNPGGSAEDWATYQAEGRHLAHPNLHPEVRKLNWLFCREGVDDPQAAIASLVEQLRHQEQLVHLHTELLLKALNWESHQRQSEYLLIGNDRREAEAWLTAETEDQPAYYPTDLQCSFIAASIKQVDGTTQAFLCVADDYVGLDDTVDGSKFATAIAMPLRRTLQRAGITVWNPQTDVEPGENLQGAIERGVEETDNVVFVLSAEALKSALCLSILNRALQLNKRIIPVMPEGTEALKLPPVLKSLQPIHLAQDGQVLRAAGVEQLIGALQQDKAYYRTHKLLLRKALKWERQKQNPSILLRGNELRRMATWLDVSQGHLHPPTALQTQYVRESAKQPPDQTVDVLLTYASEDIEFARRLNQTLQVQSKTTWFAQDQTADVADTADLQQAIENAENMVVVLSPSLA
ncbi:MAG: toll/interleukin-1 receptor domain-containing protein, partial [Cyanobacteria bacterium P01_A01_bin.135]